MLRFVEKPNLPQGRVRLLLVGNRYIPELRLDRYGAETIGIDTVSALPLAEAAHADMQVIHLYRNKILFCANHDCNAEKLYSRDSCFDESSNCKAKELYKQNADILAGSAVLTDKYPNCAAYNALILDKLAIFNPKCIDSALLKYLKELQYQLIPVRQGYARCSVCVVQADAVITADNGIAAALENYGVDVLRIKPGRIELPGYDYGFIGGASFKLAPDVLAFTGKIDDHPDAANIQSFAEKHGVRICTLTERPIYDIGSAIPMMEEVCEDAAGESGEERRNEKRA